ncbi:exopolyphosphatase PRUNE1 [Achroia grisella]|uniref:exopolyphosphatase PRUNE1 n=1 Tax=Achroia grisella TaxID=688607 RepID=UPI0027D321C3|nr:exopolyphosphatase PRUNE1 [Achroia grisella]
MRSKSYGNLNIVFGNESCDLDSAISAIVYACFLHWQHEQIKCKVCTKDNREEHTTDDIFVPILNVDREDFALKTEVSYLLKEHGINKSHLVFRNDFDLKELSANTNTKITLVDHHVLATKDQFLDTYVTEIIDHRPIDKSKWTFRDDTRSTIEVVGCCCTLIAQRIKDLSSLFVKDVDFFNAYPGCSDMLHSTIILDTVNLSKPYNKATPKDVEIILFLENIIKPRDSESDRKSKLERLTKARSDVSGLTAAELLRKDLKIAGDVLIPTFPILVQEFLQRPDVLDALSAILSQRDCNLAVLIGIDLKGEMKRDMAVYSADNTRATRLSKFLQEWTSPAFNLSTPISNTDCIYFIQSNLSATRKQYIPAIHEFLNVKN